MGFSFAVHRFSELLRKANDPLKNRKIHLLARNVLAHATPIAGLFFCSGENPRDPCHHHNKMHGIGHFD
jgi:hypothetical protein